MTEFAAVLGVSKLASPNEVVFTLVFATLFGFAGYRISSRHRLLRGVTPWRFPSLLWALICFIIGPIGLVVELVAEFTTRPRLPSTISRFAPRPAPTPAPSSAPPMIAVAPTGTPDAAVDPVSDVRPAGPPVPKDEHGEVASFGWYPDPSGRHQLRYFDGRRWNDAVADDGNRSVDPLN